MGIESLYADDIEAGIQHKLANPGQPYDPSFSTTAMLSAGIKGIPAAGLQVGASVLDILSPAAQEVARRPRLKVQADQPDDRARVEATAKFVKEGGDIMRAEASTYSPDPTTAHTAEQVLFGFTRVGTKVAAALAVANLPTAAGLLAAEGTNNSYRELIAKGIDPATAFKAAAVEGAGQAAAVIPMAGPTIKATAALSLAAGPGAFMAQEALSRRILKQAGYNDEASRHDPLDPLGLTISTLLPAVFGGAHAVGLARRPTLADVVLSNESGGKRYGTDGQLLTSPKGAQGEMQVMPKTATDPGFGVVPAKDTSPEELARVGRDYLDAMVHRYGSADQAMAAYNAGPGAVDAALLHGPDWLKHLPKETQDYVAKGIKKLGDDNIKHAASDPEAVDAARVRVTQDALHRSMPDDVQAPSLVLHASDELAAGRMPDLPSIADVQDLGGFTTAKGSTYEIGEGGITTRNKAERADVGHEGDFGQKEASEATYYVTPEQAQMLGEIQTRGGAARTLEALPDGRIGLKYAEGKDAGKFEGRTVIEPAQAPAVGLTPVETWKGGKEVHFGNEIVSVRPAKAPQLVRTAAGETPAPTAQQSVATNVLPHPDSVTIEPQTVAATKSTASTGEAKADPAVAARVKQLADELPDMLVQLPGTDRAIKVETALRQAKEAHDLEVSESNLIKAALECALSFGA